MYKTMVRGEYARAVAESKATPALKQMLRSSERVPQFIDKLADELIKAERIIMDRGRLVNWDTLRATVRDITHAWLAGLELEANRRQESDISKSERLAKVDRIVNPEKHLADMGVVDEDEINQEA